MRSLEYLGHVVTADGIQMQAGKVKSICEYPARSNIKGVRQFLGMVGYCQPFIQNFARLAKPLPDLTTKDVVFKWEVTDQQVFDTLKRKLLENPILVYPCFSKEFYIACDASSTGLGAVLLQKGKMRMRAIFFASAY